MTISTRFLATYPDTCWFSRPLSQTQSPLLSLCTSPGVWKQARKIYNILLGLHLTPLKKSAQSPSVYPCSFHEARLLQEKRAQWGEHWSLGMCVIFSCMHVQIRKHVWYLCVHMYVLYGKHLGANQSHLQSLNGEPRVTLGTGQSSESQCSRVFASEVGESPTPLWARFAFVFVLGNPSLIILLEFAHLIVWALFADMLLAAFWLRGRMFDSWSCWYSPCFYLQASLGSKNPNQSVQCWLLGISISWLGGWRIAIPSWILIMLAKLKRKGPKLVKSTLGQV